MENLAIHKLGGADLPVGRGGRFVLLAKALATRASLVALFLLPVWQHLLFSEAGFHHLRPTSVDYRASLLLFATLTLLVTALFWGIHKTPPRIRPWLGSVFLSGILLPPLHELTRLIEGQFPMALLRTPLYHALPIILCLVAIATCRQSYWKLWRLILISLPFTLLIIGKTGWALTQSHTIEPTFGEQLPQSATPPLTNRVVWIIFDELDYRLTSRERPASISLPNFDALAATSYRLTNAQSPSSRTMLAVPSLVDGVAYSAAFPVGPAQLRLRGPDGVVTQWGAQSNVFTDCRDHRGRSAAIGWYFPYRRIFGDVVNYTFWQPNSGERFVGQGRSIIETMQMQVLAVLPVWRKILHADTLASIESEALTTLTNAAFDLCFIHFPVPHIPAIVGTLSITNLMPLLSDPKAYIGNLHRADALMGRCLQALESSPTGLRTTLIVSSDHPWRMSKMFDGQSDPRVPFFIRFSGQKSGRDIGTPFATLGTRTVIRKLLAAEIPLRMETWGSYSNNEAALDTLVTQLITDIPSQ